jgi:hypothetical protein
MVPDVQDQMEGCPADEGLNMLYLALTGLLGVFLISLVMGTSAFFRKLNKAKESEKLAALKEDENFVVLQNEMYGDKSLHFILHNDSNGTQADSVTNSIHSSKGVSGKNANVDQQSNVAFTSDDGVFYV